MLDQQATTSLDISSLFTTSRFPSNNLKIFFFCLYFPLGCALALLRFFVAIHAFLVSCLLRKCGAVRKFVLRIFCTILGIVVFEENVRNDEHATIIVSNHISSFDHIVLDLLSPCTEFLLDDLPVFVQWCLGVCDLGGRNGHRTLINNAKAFTDHSTLLVFPEEMLINGRVGLARFNSWPFSLKKPVQPAFIRIERPPFADLAPTSLGSGLLLDIFWFFFVPYSIFRVSWLPVFEAIDEETPEEFAERVRTSLANVVDVVATNFTHQDCVDFVKKYKQDQKRQRTSSSSNHRLDSLAGRVKEMLPHVPLHVIRKDLERTGSVDVTVSNLLENRIPFTPELVSSHVAPKKVVKSLPNDPTSWKSLYEERKILMIAECRRKYLQKRNFL